MNRFRRGRAVYGDTVLVGEIREVGVTDDPSVVWYYTVLVAGIKEPIRLPGAAGWEITYDGE